jgi:hypothetical protein
VLAIEIVSPTSQSMDRITKPALFAWRIDLPLTRLRPRHL